MAEFMAFSILILLFSVIVHEVAHGLAARHFGDHTAERAGRITLNPLPHIDPIGTILLPLMAILSGSRVLFGWAKPVPINPLNFSDIRRGELVVSLAGVAANFALATAGSLIIHLLFWTSFNPGEMAFVLLDRAVNLNLSLAVFNLLPVSPLDGSKVLTALLPFDWARKFLSLDRYGPWILLGLIFINLGNGSIIDLILRTVIPALRNLLFL